MGSGARGFLNWETTRRMKWVGAEQLVPAGVRTSLQAASLTYVGAAGLAGLALVAGMMLTPAGEAVVGLVAEPARELVQMLVPATIAQVAKPARPQAEATSGTDVVQTPIAGILAVEVSGQPAGLDAVAQPDVVGEALHSVSQPVPVAPLAARILAPVNPDQVAPETAGAANAVPSALAPGDLQNQSTETAPNVAFSPLASGQMVETSRDGGGVHPPSVSPTETRRRAIFVASATHGPGDQGASGPGLTAPQTAGQAPSAGTGSSDTGAMPQATRAPTLAAIVVASTAGMLEPVGAPPTQESLAGHASSLTPTEGAASAPAHATGAPTAIAPNTHSPVGTGSGLPSATAVGEASATAPPAPAGATPGPSAFPSPVPPVVPSPVPPIAPTPRPPTIATPHPPVVATPVPPVIQTPARPAIATPVAPRIPTPRPPAIAPPRPPGG